PRLREDPEPNLPPLPPLSRPGVLPPVLMSLVHALLWLPFLRFLLVGVPSFKKIFSDFNMKLPWFTELLIDISDWFLDFLPVVILLALLLLLAGAVILFFLWRSSRTSWVWFLLMFLPPFALFSVSWEAMFVPFIQMMEALSK